MSAHLWIPQWLDDEYDSSASWYCYCVSNIDSTVGYEIRLSKSVNIHAIYTILEGKLRPAYYPSFEPDDSSGIGDALADNYNYHVIDASNEYAEWDIPAGTATMDTLYFYGIQSDAVGSMDVVRYRAGSPTTVGTIDWDGEASALAKKSLDASSTPIAAGDSLRIQWSSEETDSISVAGWYGVDTDGVPSGTQHRALTSTAHVHQAGTGLEQAYRLAPADSEPKFVGSYIHQGDVDATEVNPTNSWTKSGEAWTLAGGYYIDTFVFTRSSEVYYDAENQDLGTLETVYTFGNGHISVANTFTAGATLDAGALYPAMFKPDNTDTIYDDAGNSYDLTPGDSTTHYPDDANKYLYTCATGEGGRVTFVLDSMTATSIEHFVQNVEASEGKCYWRDAQYTDAEDISASTSWGGSWTMRFGRYAYLTPCVSYYSTSDGV